MTGKEFYFDRCKNSPCGEDKRIYKVHVDISRPTTFIPHHIKKQIYVLHRAFQCGEFVENLAK